MSLYGSARRYTVGAVRNAQLLPVVFPGWTLRFYCETPPPKNSNGTAEEKYGAVPTKIIAKLVELGAEVRYVDVSKTGLAPMLWRFLVAEDGAVEAFTVRDCDSRLTARDAAAVAEWLRTTNASFHCVRDHPSHSWHVVSGGLWGGRPRGLRPLIDGVTRSVMPLYGSRYYDDMKFLSRHVWPKVRHAAVCHDSVSCRSFPAARPFPVGRVGFEHVGQVFDEDSQAKKEDVDIIASAAVDTACVPN